MERTKFKHHTQIRVRNYEIDWQGIVHNANHLLYFEVGRVTYLCDVGIKVDINTIQHDSKVVVARNEIDYRSPARFGEVLEVYTRISCIRETSFAFEGFIEESASRRLISENVSVHVWLDHRTDRPLRVPEEFRKWVQGFEGSNVSIP
ncbi:MAG TPA: thioesterase family protein [Bacteroidota bacterium]|jgi:acyl-CoA thioester hydrolase|nr:thioesterase family protein [Bacteroidota bacterium]